MTADSLTMAGEWLVRNRPDRTLDELDRLGGDDGVSLTAYRLRAAALSALDREDAAIDVARQGLGLHGPDTVLLHVLGEALTFTHRLDEAERAYLDGLALDPEDVSLLCGYAFLCMTVGQFAKAQALLDRAAAADPLDPDVERGRAFLVLARGDHRQADRHTAELLRNDPESTAAHAVRGSVAAHRGDARTAFRSYAWVASQAPQQRAYVDLAREARAANHWALRPLCPLQRFGPVPVWLTFVGTLLLVRALRLPAPVVWTLVGSWLVFCVYSWTAPPLVRWWERRR